MPLDRDFDVFALYVDPEDAELDADKYEVGGNRAAKDLNNAAIRQSTSTGQSIHPDQIESRTALRVRSGERLSFGTYFNAFPASYWRRWTVVQDVRLTVEVSGRGATVDRLPVPGQRPLAARRLGHAPAAEAKGTFVFELSLKPFVDGGWYWYNVVAGDDDAVVESAEWSAEVPEDRAEHGTADIAITTMNRPDFCAKLLAQMGTDELLQPYLDTVMVMEQGTDKVVDSEVFPAAQPRARRQAADHRAGQPRRLRRLRPRPARVAAQGHRDVRADDGRRRRLRARGDHPRGHLRRPGPPPDDRRRPHVQPLQQVRAAQLRRDRAAVAVLVDDAARRLQPLGPLGPQPALGAVAAQAGRRRLQRLVHVPDPAAW